MTVIVGLTGGIAMGKTTISQFLKSKAIPVVDADQIAHEILTVDEVKVKLMDTFGESILDKNQNIDRRKLGPIVFNDQRQLEKLNIIVQPYIRTEIVRQLDTFSASKVVVLDAPVLFEQGYEKMVDYLMVIKTSAQIQVERLMQRDSLNEIDAQKRIQAQMPIEEKVKKADIVIDTSGTIEETRSQVVKWLVDKNLF
ncbi:dephospho-CoA kinase [Pediococcus pentosaceus]|jgi:dephospho-CoA kinase|uniref:Dephospho-CoA kinase n=3 Tax=Pediococcus pentosaceus TaxID=1255 RepID=A0A0Q0YI07_PEDPE|nr:dephospho-CoA kinase [Pediococcus pentosaceus]ABJ67751.1 dephospho-CoA kinase [Pediococcus pentosaceus ATCC 25745]AHA04883.1 dephospho-CoA kinase [Pediococcus pentosaceus SL4]ANI98086.1 dephospho-CoA kinase [Pediococcus pentosaceus]ASC08690.1 Dephospho-CoA kinase [Pediococcus pentosaceus]AVL01321.1 dephospho-CoA kinase [Pediococcus pentosaceus]